MTAAAGMAGPAPPPLFRRHPQARILGPDGARMYNGPALACIPERPPAWALAGVFAAADTGLAFRVGETAAEPAQGAGSFETLTSGSSGMPRRIRRSQASWIASFAVNAARFGIGPGVRVAIPGRLTQSLALYGAIEAVHLGAEAHLLDGLRPDRQVAALRMRQIDVLYAAPAQLRLMLESQVSPVVGLRLIMTAGSKLDPATRAGLALRFPAAEICEVYGAAETSFVTLSDAATPKGSVGRAYPGAEIDLRGPAGAQEVWVRSPYLFDGYAGAAGGARWHDGWLTVGDIGQMRDGFLFLSGRAGRMVTVADQNVFPEEIEAFLLDQPGVMQAAVLPRADPRRGQVLDAVVKGGDPAALLAACRRRLGPLKAPRRVHLVADWPLLASGKTDLAALQGFVG
ncbi:MAG: AMP-binding protein [Rhodobacter sp.]|nr:AMP-binding protein [Rhodobacter sp.]